MRTPLRSLALKLHLWLGLTAGTVVAIVCVTGAILAFESDLIRMSAPWRYRAPPVPTPVAAPTVPESLPTVEPEATLTGITVYEDVQRPIELNFGSAGRAYVHPTDGTVIESGVKRPVFFAKTQELHRFLLAGTIGRGIVGACTIAFVFILIFGLILWWPKTQGALKARINPFAVFGKHGGWRRKLHDLHVSLGVWCLVPLMVMALTGLPEGYRWATRFLYVVTGSADQPPAPSSTSDSTLPMLALDSALTLGKAALGEAKQWTVRAPARPTGAIAVVALPHDAWHDRAVDQVYLDRVTGVQLRLDRWEDLTPGFRARRSIYPWHFGTVWGFPSKLVAFLACLFGATFPITGFLMYRAGKGREA
jgi:uncharacterized iron-regulated membrane protein